MPAMRVGKIFKVIDALLMIGIFFEHIILGRFISPELMEFICVALELDLRADTASRPDGLR